MGNKRKPPVGRRFQPGQSGNPSGRPSHKDFKEWLDAPSLGPGGTRRGNVFEALYGTAINPRAKDQIRAIELILAYALGKPVQGVQLSGPNGGPMKVEGDDPVTTMLRAMISKRNSSNDDGGDSGGPG